MNLNEVNKKVTTALGQLNTEEEYLLVNNLSERCLAHKLAEKLQRLFDEYNVDCEYDKDVSDLESTKAIFVFQEEAQNYYDSFMRSFEERYDSFQNRFIDGKWKKLVIPDVIIHKRGTQENLLIIEIKKTRNVTLKSKQFDNYKLCKYTSEDLCGLKYLYGLYLELNESINQPERPIFHNLKYYKKGEVVLPETLD